MGLMKGAAFLSEALDRIDAAERAARRKLVECDYLGRERANAAANDLSLLSNEELDRRVRDLIDGGPVA